VAYALAYGVAKLALGLLDATNLLYDTLIANLAATLVIFIAGTLVRNSSLYDPYWSVVPIVIAFYWLSQLTETFANPIRAVMVLGLITLWGVRLTYNCFRRWKDLTQEDYRYIEFREKTGKFYWLVDLFGIQIFPTLIVFIGMLPVYAAMITGSEPFNRLDMVAFLVTFMAIMIELVADQQLVGFQKKAATKEKVCTRGLWSWSRHPNYFGEILFWWGLFLFGLAAAPDQWWLSIGAVAMTLLFALFSIPNMEARSRLRRPDYEKQVEGISLIIPKPRKRPV
jgi:steroid 5-alpha reductase family enzyme